ncbi:hypothetical protein JEZ13_00440 [bacterium]|nr:hypothetical protein [bacterium]
MKLIEISKYIGSGLVMNRYQAKSEKEIINRYRVLTIKSLDSVGSIDETELEDFSAGRDIPEKYIAKAGDVFIRNSFPFTSGYIKSHSDYHLIISSNFTVIRPMEDRILPAYLSIYLNSIQMQDYFNRVTSPSSMKFIKAETIKQLELDLMILDKQQDVIKLFSIMQEELTLMKDIFTKKDILYRKMINELIGGRNVR